MDSVTKARQTQLTNIQSKTGKSVEEWRAILADSKLTKHGELRKMVMEKFGLGFGDADMLVHFSRSTDGQSAAEDAGLSDADVLDALYGDSGKELRSLHEQLVAEINKFGEYSILPKKGYVSLRCKRQFAMIGPGTRNRLEIGLNLKGIEGTPRLIPQTKDLMCQFRVFLSRSEEIDEELLHWLSLAFKASL